MAEMHKCGQGWAYCDGNCATCATNIPTYTNTSTDDNFHWFGRNTDGKPTGGFGGKSGRSGFITRIEPGKEEPYTVIFTTADLDKYRYIEDECCKMIGHSKPTTNADKYIRHATDEEMARLIADDWCEVISCDALYRECDGECEWRILKWLKQEVESDG